MNEPQPNRSGAHNLIQAYCSLCPCTQLSVEWCFPCQCVEMYFGMTGFGSLSEPGARFTNVFSIAIQIWWKFRFTLISILMQWSLQNFIHGTTVCCRGMRKNLLRSYVQQRNYGKAKFPSKLNCGQKTVSETGPWSVSVVFMWVLFHNNSMTPVVLKCYLLLK